MSNPIIITIKDTNDELWARGEIETFLNKTQQKINQIFEETKLRETIHVLNCSRKIGKSVYGLFKLSEVCIKKPDALCVYIAPTVGQVSELAEQLFKVVFSTLSERYRPTLNKTQLTFPNGSKILFRGVGNGVGDSYDNLRSFAFDAAILDEAGFPRHLDDIVKGVLVDTLRPRKGWLLMLSSPPKSPNHPFKDYCAQAKLDGTYHEFTILQSHYTQEEIAKAIKDHGGIDSTSCQRELFCKFLVEEEFVICPEFDANLHAKEVNRDQYFQFYHKYLSLDPSQGRDFTCVLFGFYDFRNQTLIIEDEIEMHGQELITIDLAKRINEKKQQLGYLNPYLQLSDSNEPRLLRDLAQEPYKLFFSPIEDKGSKQSQVSHLREMFREGRIKINPKCKYLILCLESGVWKADKDGRVTSEFERSDTLGHFDAIDALIYLILNLNTYKNPIPLSYQATADTVFPNNYNPEEQKGHLPEGFLKRIPPRTR